MEIVLSTALITIDALVSNDVCCLTVSVYLFARALTWLTELGRYFEVLHIL